MDDVIFRKGKRCTDGHMVPGSPRMTPANEDEYSYVLEGRLGALLGEDVVYAGPGTLVFKPRGQWHTFWNAGDGPCRILEIISPGGFEHLFDEAAGGAGTRPDEPPDARYGLELDHGGIRRRCEEHGLTFPDGQ